MSDRELVTFDVQQFTTLIGRLDTLNNTLWNINEQLKRREGEKLDTLIRKVNEFMATQEERLQAILAAVQNVKQMLADLKVNNPAIEDEITAIEKELAPADQPPTEPTP